VRIDGSSPTRRRTSHLGLAAARARRSPSPLLYTHFGEHENSTACTRGYGVKRKKNKSVEPPPSSCLCHYRRRRASAAAAPAWRAYAGGTRMKNWAATLRFAARAATRGERTTTAHGARAATVRAEHVLRAWCRTAQPAVAACRGERAAGATLPLPRFSQDAARARHHCHLCAVFALPSAQRRLAGGDASMGGGSVSGVLTLTQKKTLFFAARDDAFHRALLQACTIGRVISPKTPLNRRLKINTRRAPRWLTIAVELAPCGLWAERRVLGRRTFSRKACVATRMACRVICGRSRICGRRSGGCVGFVCRHRLGRRRACIAPFFFCAEDGGAVPLSSRTALAQDRNVLTAACSPLKPGVAAHRLARVAQVSRLSAEDWHRTDQEHLPCCGERRT